MKPNHKAMPLAGKIIPFPRQPQEGDEVIRAVLRRATAALKAKQEARKNPPPQS
jgi:hypothetical protein